MAMKRESPVADRHSRLAVSLSLEEVESLSPDDVEKLRAELRAAEDRIAAGQFVVYDREDQRRRFEKIYSDGA